MFRRDHADVEKPAFLTDRIGPYMSCAPCRSKIKASALDLRPWWTHLATAKHKRNAERERIQKGGEDKHKTAPTSTKPKSETE